MDVRAAEHHGTPRRAFWDQTVTHIGDDLIGHLLIRPGCRSRKIDHFCIFRRMRDHHRQLTCDERRLVFGLRIGQGRHRHRSVAHIHVIGRLQCRN